MTRKRMRKILKNYLHLSWIRAKPGRIVTAAIQLRTLFLEFDPVVRATVEQLTLAKLGYKAHKDTLPFVLESIARRRVGVSTSLPP